MNVICLYVLEVLYFLKCFYRANLVAIIHCVVAECFVESSDERTQSLRVYARLPEVHWFDQILFAARKRITSLLLLLIKSVVF